MKQRILLGFLVLLVSVGSAQAQAPDLSGLGDALSQNGIRTGDAVNNYAPKDIDRSQRRFEDDPKTVAMQPIMQKASGEAGTGAGLGGSFDSGGRVEYQQDAVDLRDTREQTNRSANSEVATGQTMAMTVSKDGLLRTGIRMLDPALADGSADAQIIQTTTNQANSLNPDQGEGPQYQAIKDCVFKKVNQQKMSATDAEAKCLEEMKPASGPNGSAGEASFLANHAAHPTKYGNLIPGGSSRPKNEIWLTDLLANRRLGALSLTVKGVVGMFPIFDYSPPTSGPKKEEFDAIKKALDLLTKYSGNAIYKADGTKFVRSSITPAKSHEDRYKVLLEANYIDLASLTRDVCGFENRVDALDQAPFRSTELNIFGASIPIALQNDIWAYFRKNKMDESVDRRLKNLSAGAGFPLTIEYPVALNQFFISTERVMEEQQSDGGSAIKVKCGAIKATKDELNQYLSFLKQYKTSNSLSPRVSYTIMLAHYITMAQLAYEANMIFMQLATSYGAPQQDSQFMEVVQGQPMFVAIKDLRHLLGTSMGIPGGDPYPLREFVAYYGDAVERLKNAAILLAKDLDQTRGVAGSTLAGVTTTGGTGNPMK